MSDGITTQNFSGYINNGQTITETIFTLNGWTSAYLELIVLAQDVNSNTNRLYFRAEYGWYRQWDTAPENILLLESYNNHVGEALYEVRTVANGNDIQVTLSQSGFDTNSVYRIVANYMIGKQT